MKTLWAYAKLNLFLDYLGKRKDGYHEVNYVNTPISLATKLEIEYNDSGEIKLESKNNIPLDETNFIHKIITRVKENFGLDFGIKVKIEKGKEFNGLGIGSSETAKILNELNQNFNLGMTKSELCEIVKDITSDACFSLYETPAIIRGFGERVFPLKKIDFWGIVFGVPANTPEKKTKWMFSKIKKEDFQPKDILPMVDAVIHNNFNEIKNNLYNFFEKLDVPEYEESFKLIKELRAKGYGSILCGAGPSVFAICKSKEEAEALAQEYKKYDLTIIRGM